MTQDFRPLVQRVRLEVGNCLAGANISIWFWWADRFVQAGGYSAGPGRCVGASPLAAMLPLQLPLLLLPPYDSYETILNGSIAATASLHALPYDCQHSDDLAI
eukprot:COSAG05_NODE_2024_length_3677_cov_2.848239_3_plen_103_part_00